MLDVGDNFMKLFCLPYAGGNERIYFGWNRYAGEHLEVVPVELKGRGRRFNEGFYNDVEEAVDDIFTFVKNSADDKDYALYGHSMGSLLAYELYYKILQENFTPPKHIFFSGYKSPDIKRKDKVIHDLPNDEFVKELVNLGGTPKELFENDELIEFFTPVIRNDFKIVEKYEYVQKQDKIKCDISVFNGKDDDVKLHEILAWKNHAGKGFKAHHFNGDHFFINDNAREIVNLICHTLI